MTPFRPRDPFRPTTEETGWPDALRGLVVAWVITAAVVALSMWFLLQK